MNGFGDRYLYVTREVDGTLFNLLDETQKTAVLYQQMESDRTAYLFNLRSLFCTSTSSYCFVSFIRTLVCRAIIKPIGRLAAAAKRVGAGELTTQVIEDDGDDEMLSLDATLIK